MAKRLPGNCDKKVVAKRKGGPVKVYNAARIVDTGSFVHSTRSQNDNKDSKDATDVLAQDISDAVNATELCQMTRDQHVESASMKHALQYEHHQLINPKVVSMPEPDRGRVFDPVAIRSDETRGFVKALFTLQANIKEKLVTVSCFFKNMRQRPYVLWPVRCGPNHWVTIFMRIGDKDWVKKLLNEENNMMLFHDKVVESLAIINPWPETRPRPRTVAYPLTNERVFLTLHAILLEGGILLPRSAIRHVDVPPATELWQTGYISFAVCREILRRLKVWTFRGDDPSKDEFLWMNFEEAVNTDGWHEAMAAGCAIQAVQLGQYRPRLAIGLPGAAGVQNPASLDARASGQHHWPGHNDAPEEFDVERIRNEHVAIPCPKFDGPGEDSVDDEEDAMTWWYQRIYFGEDPSDDENDEIGGPEETEVYEYNGTEEKEEEVMPLAKRKKSRRS